VILFPAIGTLRNIRKSQNLITKARSTRRKPASGSFDAKAQGMQGNAAPGPGFVSRRPFPLSP
jgi:hypothetical protein